MARKTVHRWVGVAGLLVCFSGAARPAGQAPQTPAPVVPTFKALVEYVEVDVLVTDQQGQFVRGLTPDDFQVFEDGKRQTISAFSVVDIPIERQDRPLFAARPIEPDVVGNERPFDGRVYVMILDDIHVSALRTQRVRNAARQFIERNLGANDLMAVVYTGGRAQDAQEFTNNRRLLLGAVDRFMGQKLQSATLNRNEVFFRERDLGASPPTTLDPEETERAYKTRMMIRQLQQVSEWFGGIHGRRKTILLFSEGLDYDLTDIIRQAQQPSSQVSTILADVQDAINATQRANVTIYAIDPRGLTDLGDDAITVSSFAAADDPQAGAGIGLRGLQNELLMSQNSLRQLADETGGFASVNRNEFGTAFDRIVRDNSSYYVLAYYPPNPKRDGKFHRIEVKTTRPGLVVRARRGYSAPRGKAPQTTKTGGMPPELFEAVNSPIPVSGITLRTFAAPFKGTAPNASVLVGIEIVGSDLSLQPNSKVEISLMAVDRREKLAASRNDSLTMNLRPDTRTRVEQSGVRILNRLDLAPGRYQLRVAARDGVKAKVGSVVYDLEVPDFYKEPISLSGLAIASLGSGALLTARPDEALKNVLPAPPVGARVFAQNDELALFAEVYDNTGKTPHKVDITASILTDEGRVLFKNEETRDSSELGGARGGYGYTARIPLSGIAPGLYVLNVEGRSRLGQGASAVRQVQFRIVPARAQ